MVRQASEPDGHGVARWRLPRRLWLIAGLAIMAIAVLAIGGFVWYVSDRIESDALRPDHSEHRYGLEVVAASDAAVTVRSLSDSNWRRRGIWALQWRTADSEGWVQVGDPIEVDEETHRVTRPVLRGEVPPVGAEARLENYAFLGTPQQFGLAYEEIRYETGHGPADAWLVCGDRSSWLIMVHGKNGEPAEGLRIVPTIADLGFAMLAIDYTNDVGAPANDSGRYEYGVSEWRDLEGAVGYALDHGAEQIVLFGYSMGGAIVTSFLLESDLVPRISAAVLDAPMLDLKRTVTFGLADAGVPGPLRLPSTWLASRRFDVDWSRVDYEARAAELSTPLLIFHGSDDDVIPIEVSEDLAAARPDLVTYERFDGAHHTGSWNVDPVRYEAALRAFVGAHTETTASPPDCAAAAGRSR